MENYTDVDKLYYQDEQEFLTNLESNLSIVETRISKFVQDISRALVDSGLDPQLHNLSLEDKEKVQDLFRSFPKTSAVNQRDIKDREKRISELETECGELRTQLEYQIKENERAQQQIEDLKCQILNQSTYCANLGAVLGNLTWRASRFPQIVDVWLSAVIYLFKNIFQHRIAEFLSITNGSFVAFVNTYGECLPPSSNVEYQFVIGLLGVVTNITASPEGREFLISNKCGKDFVQKIIIFMPTLPISQCSITLKRLMLMILYNVSMNKTGLQHLFESRVGGVLNYYLENKSLPEEMQLLCLRVLQSITYGLTNPIHIHDLNTSISIEKIEDIAISNITGVSDVAKQVIKHLRKAQELLNSS